MKRITIFIALISFVVFCFSSTAYADTTIHLEIETATGTLYNDDIAVAPCDNDNDAENSTMAATAYCAILQSGLANDWSWFESDAFLNSIETTVNNDNDNGVYWGWFANLNLGETALNKYTLEENDLILLNYGINPLKISVDEQNPTVGDAITFTVTEFGYDDSWNPVWSPASGGKILLGSDIFDLTNDGSYSLVVPDTNTLTIKGQKDNFIDTPEIIIIPQAETPSPSPSGGSRKTRTVEKSEQKAVFDLNKAIQFLSSQQKENGSWGEDIYTDWIAISIASLENQNPKIESTIKLIKYFGESQISGTRLTDFERHAMALMSLGLNPYNTNGGNYIKKITDSFDGKQFGDANEDNDDIFALIVLQNAGFTQNDKMIESSLHFILSRQKENGSWDESVDMTGAAIEALSTFSPTPGIGESLMKAKEFLKQSQKDTGGWSNVSSTAWAMGGILALNEKPEDWVKGGNTPLDYLATNQDSDGGIRSDYWQNKIWETSYALTALSGKTWNQVMQRFEKPAEKITLEKREPLEEKMEMILSLLKESRTEEKALRALIAKNTLAQPSKNTEIAKVPKEENKKENLENPENPANPENIAIQNVATPLLAIKENPVIQEAPAKDSWFKKILDKIFKVD